MPTWATLAKGIAEGGVVVAFMLVAGKYVVSQLMTLHREAIAAFREELQAEREAHDKEAAAALDKFHLLHEDHLEFRSVLTESIRHRDIR